MTADFNFFLPITKIDKERRLISGYASTPALDLDGEIVALDAVRKALPGYWQWRNIRRMHTADAVGVAKEANVDDKGLFLTAKIVDDDCWKKVLEGVYKGYSIGGKKLAKNGNTITEIELVEVSVVDRPANPECKFDVSKAASDGAAAILAKLPKSFRDPRDRALGKMAQAIEIIAKAPVEAGPPEFLTKAPADGFQAPAKSDANLCKHGNDPETCAKCMKRAAKVAKREVKRKERESLASQGKALPDGSFPIKDKSDLANARQAIGRSKNPTAARALIRRRARELGVSLPDNWKSLGSADPSFLTLSADGGKGMLAKGTLAGHDAALAERSEEGRNLNFTKRERKLLKRMGVAGSLAYCFDSMRNAQRDLLREAQQEGGDMKDKALAEKLGSVASQLAAVIGQKADHEGQEALDLTDADDQGFLTLGGMEMSAQVTKNFKIEDIDTNDPMVAAVAELMKRAATPSRAARMQMARGDLKKARKSVKDMEDAIKSAHGILKARYLAKSAIIKAGKKPADDGDADDDMEAMGKVMGALNKAFGSASTLKTFIKSANVQLKKAASRSGQRGQEVSDGNADYKVPVGVKDLTPGDVDTAGGTSAPFVHGMETPFPGKSAKVRKGFVSATEAEALARAAAAEAKVEVLGALPSAPVFGKRPAITDMSKIIGGTKDEAVSIMKGVDPADLTRDEESNARAVSKMIGNMILGGHGKSVFDDNFRGTGGLN